MKKLITFTLIISIIITMAGSTSIFAAAKTFPDVKTTDWFYKDVTDLVAKGAIDGYPNKNFGPGDGMTVGQFIKVVVIALGYDVPKGTGHWANTYIQKATELGMVKLDEFSVKDYDRKITRAEMSRVVIRKLNEKYPDDLNTYASLIKDYSTIGAADKEFILKVYFKGIITGYPNGNFGGNDNAKRCEACAIIMRMIDPARRKVPTLPVTSDIYGPVQTMTSREFMDKYYFTERSSKYYYTVDIPTDKLMFSQQTRGEYTYKLSEKITPGLNKKVLDMMKALADDKHYVHVQHWTDNGVGRVYLNYMPGYLSNAYGGSSFFLFFIPDTGYLDNSYKNINPNFSSNVVMKMELGQLWIDRPSQSEEGWCAARYAKKLRDSLTCFFGDSTGRKIFKYAVDEYMAFRTAPDNSIYRNKSKVTIIDNVQVDYYTNSSALLFFNFSYTK